MKAPVRDSAVPLPPLFDSACAMVCRNCCSRAAMSVAGASDGVCGFKASKSLVKAVSSGEAGDGIGAGAVAGAGAEASAVATAGAAPNAGAVAMTAA